MEPRAAASGSLRRAAGPNVSGPCGDRLHGCFLLSYRCIQRREASHIHSFNGVAAGPVRQVQAVVQPLGPSGDLRQQGKRKTPFKGAPFLGHDCIWCRVEDLTRSLGRKESSLDYSVIRNPREGGLSDLISLVLRNTMPHSTPV